MRYPRPVNRLSDGDVAAAFHGGRPDALSTVYERYAALVYAVALRSLGDWPDAEDLTQQVFVAAWRRQGTFDPDRGSLPSWLIAIARNKVTDVLRVRQRESGALREASGRMRKPCPIWTAGPVEASRTRARAVSDAEMPTSRSSERSPARNSSSRSRVSLPCPLIRSSTASCWLTS